MKTVGIICEFNPLHRGHEHLINTVRENGAEVIICVMSGNSVQRGEPALIPAIFRAEAAVRSGADVVVEMPYPFSSSSASFFALAGIRILHLLEVDAIAFGSETCDIDALTLAAYSFKLPDPEGAIGTAAGFFSSSDVSLEPNDILAAGYIRALADLKWKPEMIPVKRIGAGHGEDDKDYPSASVIRKKLLSGGSLFGIAESSIGTIEKAEEEGVFPADCEKAENAIIAFLRRSVPSEIKNCAECAGGVAERLCSAALKYDGSLPFSKLVATKKYTDSRLRRAALFAYTGVGQEDLRKEPAFVRLLSASKRGREYIKSKSEPSIPIVTRIREIPDTEEAQRQLELSLRFDALYSMIFPKLKEAFYFLKKPPVIV